MLPTGLGPVHQLWKYRVSEPQLGFCSPNRIFVQEGSSGYFANLEINAKLRETTIETITKSVVRERLEAEGAEPIGNTPEEFAATMKAESARWADLVKEAAIKVE
jgi:Tripartite tricarboxylate transporter family receptor